MKRQVTKDVKPSLATLKQWAASAITTGLVGMLIGFFYRRRVPFHGLLLDVDEQIPPRNRASLFWGLYESAEYRFVTEHLDPTMPVVECGSGIGAISSVIASRLAPGTPLVCVEGNPRLVPLLKRNLLRHAGHLNVEVVEGAIGHGDTKVSFVVADDNLCSRAQPAGHVRSSSLEVVGVELWSIAQKHQWSSGYQLVADIEGGEIAFLINGSESLAGCKLMIIELHDTNWGEMRLRVADLARYVTASGFMLISRYGNVFVFGRHSC